MKMLISSPSPEWSGRTRGKWPSLLICQYFPFSRKYFPFARRDIWKVTEVIWKFETWKELFCKKCERAGVGLTVLATPSLPGPQQKAKSQTRSLLNIWSGLGVKHDLCWPECVHIMCHSDCVWQITPARHNTRAQGLSRITKLLHA